MRRALAIGLLVWMSGCGDDQVSTRDLERTGFTEIELELTRDGQVVAVDPAEIRRALTGIGAKVYTVRRLPDDRVRVRVPVDPVDPAVRADAVARVHARLGDIRARWFGNRLFVRSPQAVYPIPLREDVTAAGFEVLAVDTGPPDEGTGEYNVIVRVAGPEVRYARVIAARLGVDARVVDVASVGPQRHRRSLW